MRPANPGASALALLLLACAPPAPGPVPAPRAASAEARWVAAVAPSDLSLLEAPARVVAPASASAEVTVLGEARVEAVRVLPGDRVAAGAVVAEVAAPELARAAAAAAGSARRIELLDARLAELERLRAEGLARADEVFALRERRAEAEAAKLEARAVLAAHGVTAEAERRLRDTGRLALRAPLAGLVTEIRARVGRIVGPDAPPLVVLRGEGPVRVEVTPGRPLPAGATLTLVTPDGARHALRPDPVATAIDPGTGALRVFLEPAESTSLPDGAVGRLVVDPGVGVAQVPASALSRTSTGTHVLRAGPEGRGEVAPVEVLAVAGGSALVRGVAVGDRVALDAARSPGAGED